MFLKYCILSIINFVEELVIANILYSVLYQKISWFKYSRSYSEYRYLEWIFIYHKIKLLLFINSASFDKLHTKLSYSTKYANEIKIQMKFILRALLVIERRNVKLECKVMNIHYNYWWISCWSILIYMRFTILNTPSFVRRTCAAALMKIAIYHRLYVLHVVEIINNIIYKYYLLCIDRWLYLQIFIAAI